MLWFFTCKKVKSGRMTDFNTSNVMVLPHKLKRQSLHMPYFNTSNVMVLPPIVPPHNAPIAISIHLMLWFFFTLPFTQGCVLDFNKSNGLASPLSSYKISIHLMLWFFSHIPYPLYKIHVISIHLMLWFFAFRLVALHQECVISIHLMLWFFYVHLGYVLSL